jgi:hypothetical protein
LAISITAPCVILPSNFHVGRLPIDQHNLANNRRVLSREDEKHSFAAKDDGLKPNQQKTNSFYVGRALAPKHLYKFKLVLFVAYFPAIPLKIHLVQPRSVKVR